MPCAATRSDVPAPVGAPRRGVEWAKSIPYSLRTVAVAAPGRINHALRVRRAIYSYSARGDRPALLCSIAREL